MLGCIVGALNTIAQQLPLVFPIHTRTRDKHITLGVQTSRQKTLLDSQSYMEFLNLWKDAALVLTDSGGLREETAASGIPCLRLCYNTERPTTLDESTDTLVSADLAFIAQAEQRVLRHGAQQGQMAALWDGMTAQRIVAYLDECLAK